MNRIIPLLFVFSFFIGCTELPENRATDNLDMRSYLSGKAIYSNECAACHGEQGEGYGELYPTLSDSFLYQSARSFIPCSIRKGRKNGKVFMPSFEYLNYENTTDLVNYLIEEHASEKNFLTPTETKELLKTCN